MYLRAPAFASMLQDSLDLSPRGFGYETAAEIFAKGKLRNIPRRKEGNPAKCKFAIDSDLAKISIPQQGSVQNGLRKNWKLIDINFPSWQLIRSSNLNTTQTFQIKRWNVNFTDDRTTRRRLSRNRERATRWSAKRKRKREI